MSTFFEKHKRKGALGLLLFFLGRGKGVVPLLVLVVVLSGLTVSPFSFKSPAWLDRLVGGGRGRLGPGGLSETMSASRGVDESLGRRLLRAVLPFRYDRSSVDLVRGKAIVDSKFAGKVSVKGGTTISGVIRPEDAGKMKDGIALTTEELLAGLVNSAQAGDFAAQLGRVGGPAALEALMAGRLPYYERGPGQEGPGRMFGPRRFVDPGALKGGRAVNVDLKAIVPGGATITLPQARGGKLSGLYRGSNKSGRSSAKHEHVINSEREMQVLAETNAYSRYGMKCANDASCHKEHAMTVSDHPFSGVRPDGEIALTSEDPVGVPDGAEFGYGLLAAEQMYSNYERCAGATTSGLQNVMDESQAYSDACKRATQCRVNCEAARRCRRTFPLSLFLRRCPQRNCRDTCRVESGVEAVYYRLVGAINEQNSISSSQCANMQPGGGPSSFQISVPRLCIQ